MSFIVLFFTVQLINVVFNTVRLILTVKSSKQVAAFFTALSYGIYTIVLVYTASDFNMWAKVAIAFTSNLIGVYVSMWFLERIRKDKVWRIEAIVPRLKEGYDEMLADELKRAELVYSMTNSNSGQTVITVYSENQNESQKFTDIMSKYNAKFVALETNAKVIL